MASRIIASEDGYAHSGDLFVTTHPPSYSAWRGSLAAMKKEKLIPAGMPIPKGCVQQRWSDGVWGIILKRSRPLGSKIPVEVWKSGDHFVLTRTLISALLPGYGSVIRQAALEAGEDPDGFLDSPAGRLQIERAAVAKADKKFQALLRAVRRVRRS